MLSSKQLAKQLQTLQVQSGSALLVAVSGGADSLVLLDLLLPLRAQMQLQLAAVHINHELRPESQAEEARVREYCRVHAVPLDVWHWQQAAHPASGTEAAARSFRYDRFERSAQAHDSDYILTAHHRDDQAETVLFRMMRSGSVHGIGGIAARQTWRGRILLRPLLPYSREQLRTYAVQHELPFSDDPSNADTRYSRNFIRAEVLPLMRTREPRVDDHLNRLASETQGLLALADVTLRHFLALLGPKTDEFDWTPVQDEERAVQKIVLQAALQRILPAVADTQVMQVLVALEQADGQTRYLRLDKQRELVIRGLYVRTINVGASVAMPPNSHVLNCDGQGVAYRAGRIRMVTTVQAGDQLLASLTAPTPLTLRTRQPGDRILLRDGHHQKLRRTFINERVPAHVRDCLLIATRGSDVVWIDDLRLNQLLKQPATDKIKANLVYRQ